MRFFLSQITGIRLKRRLAAWVMAMALVVGLFGALQLAQKGNPGRQVGIQMAFAEDCGGEGQPPCPPKTPPAGIVSLFTSEAGGVISLLATMLFKLMAGLLWFVLFWMGDLMDNTFILEGDIGEKLHSVWVIVRNFVNIFFAITLVVVAFLAVIGYGDESGNYGLKKFIPKMALALIAVNFTFLACRLVLDLNNVLTTAIFAIPQKVTNLSDITPSAAGATKTFKKFQCLSQSDKITELEQRSKDLETQYPGVINSLGGVCYALVPTDKDGKPVHIDFSNSKTPSPTANGGNDQEIILMGSNQFSKKDFVWTMATQFQGLHNLNRASQLLTPDFTNLTVSALFSIIFAVIYGTAYVAMFIVLVGRMVVLWVTIMLSPLAAFSIVVPDLLPEDLNIQKKFLSHAFVPLKMAIPLSFGYILISQMSLVINTNTNIVSAGSLDLTGGGEFARNVSISTLLYGAASVAIIWMGVFMASKDVVGSGLVETIKSKVESAGNTVAKWPTYLPMFPFGSSHFSLASVGHAFQAASAQITEDQRKRTEADAGSLLAPFNIIIGDLQKASSSLEQMVGSGRIDRPTLQSNVRTIVERDDSSKTEGKKVIQSMVNNKDKVGGDHGDFIANMFGAVSFEDFLRRAEIPAEVEHMLTYAKSASTSALQPPVSYSKAGEALKQNRDATFEVEPTLSTAQKELFQLTEAQQKGNTAVTRTFNDLDPDKFIEKFKGMNVDERRGTLTEFHKAFAAMSATEAFQTAAHGDGNLKKALRVLFSSEQKDEDANGKLFGVYKALFYKKDEDVGVVKKAERLETGYPGVS